MFHRSAPRGIAFLALAAHLSAQSTVRPLPYAAVPSEMAWALTRVPPTSPAPRAEIRDDLFPPTTLTRADHAELQSGRAVEDRGPEVDMDLRGLVYPESSFNEGPGSMGVARGAWDARVGWRTGKSQGLTLNLHSEASFYDFTDATALVPGSGNGQPLNDVYETSFGATMCTRTSERMSWFTSGALTLSGEDRAELDDSLTVAMVGGLRYQANEDLALQGGLGVLTLLEDSPWVVPYLGFDWRIHDSLRLQAEGSKVRLAADLDPKWTLYGQAAYEVRQYRLNDSNPLSNGVMRDEEIDVGLGLDWRPKAGMTVGLLAGLVSWRQLEFIDEDEVEVSETEADPSAFVAVTLSYSF